MVVVWLPYDCQVIEKTKGLSFRSYVLAQNIEKRSSLAAASATA